MFVLKELHALSLSLRPLCEQEAGLAGTGNEV